MIYFHFSLRWRHNGRDGVSNHQPHDYLLNRLFGRRSKKTWKLRFTGLCAGNSPGTREFPAQMASNAGNVSIWWRHHATRMLQTVWYVNSCHAELISEVRCSWNPSSWKTVKYVSCIHKAITADDQATQFARNVPVSELNGLTLSREQTGRELDGHLWMSYTVNMP